MSDSTYVTKRSPATRHSAPIFSSIDELISDQGDVTVIIDEDPDKPGHFYISAYKTFNTADATDEDISYSYLTACDLSTSQNSNLASSTYLLHSTDAPCSINVPKASKDALHALFTSPQTLIYPISPTDDDERQADTFVAKKYKPVAQKVRPVLADLPEKFHINRNIVGDPLADMPVLSPTPPPFQPTGRYTAENKERIDNVHPGDFLWPGECDLMHHFMSLQNEGFAWNDTQRGRFHEDFFPPVLMPIVEHKLWVLHNMPIPPGIFDELCRMITVKFDAGVYEHSNLSYRSRWFTVFKKGGTSLHNVHSLEPLNAVTIAHSGIPPHTEHIAEQFAGRLRRNFGSIRWLRRAHLGRTIPQLHYLPDTFWSNAPCHPADGLDEFHSYIPR